jgi:hypothetical protein
MRLKALSSIKTCNAFLNKFHIMLVGYNGYPMYHRKKIGKKCRVFQKAEEEGEGGGSRREYNGCSASVQGSDRAVASVFKSVYRCFPRSAALQGVISPKECRWSVVKKPCQNICSVLWCIQLWDFSDLTPIRVGIW